MANVIVFDWDRALYRRGKNIWAGKFRDGALDIVSNSIARAPVFIIVQRNDKDKDGNFIDPRGKVWQKFKNKNIDPIKDRILWVNAEPQNTTEEELEDNPEASQEEEKNAYENVPYFTSLDDAFAHIQKTTVNVKKGDITFVDSLNHAIFQPVPEKGSKIKKEPDVENPDADNSNEKTPLIAKDTPLTRKQRTIRGAAIAGAIFVGLAVVAAIVVLTIIFAAPAVPAALAVLAAIDIAVKAIGTGYLIGACVATAVAALGVFTAIGAFIGALSAKKSANLATHGATPDAANAPENKPGMGSTGFAQNGLKNNPPSKQPPKYPPPPVPPRKDKTSETPTKPAEVKDDIKEWPIIPPPRTITPGR